MSHFGPKKGKDYRSLSPSGKDLRKFVHESIKGGMTGYLKHVYETIMEIQNPGVKAKMLLQFLKFFMPELRAGEIDSKQDLKPIQLTFVKADGAKEIISNANPVLDAAIEEVTDDSDQGLSDTSDTEEQP